MARRKKKFNPLNLVLILLIAAIIAATGFVIKLCLDLATGGSSPSSSLSQPSKKPSKEEPPAEEPSESDPAQETVQIVSSATIGTQGDLLMHKPIITACKQEDGTYDFSSVFRYTKEYTLPLDYAIANLETTLAGSSQPYQGYPAHNCPDELADAAKAAGFDMLLTANNHCNDTLKPGIERTLEQVRQRGIEPLGTRLNSGEKRYSVVNVNGIRLGMVCYTYVMGIDGKGVCMNGANTYVQDTSQINYFSDAKLDDFYSEMQGIYSDMLSEGAEATILFIHWGEEYHLSQNINQSSVAQKMCDMGFDLIIGGHPHVVQPMDLLTSNSDPDHKTVCIYSLGNAISNQFVDQMTSQTTGHTEDGVLFCAAFDKYSDGSVYLSRIDVLPTWIIRSSENDKTEYSMVPLDNNRRNQWQSLFHLTDTQTAGASESYTRTMNILGSGLQKANDYLSSAKQLRDGQ